MKVDGKPTRTIWLEADGWSVGIIDQTVLPHRFTTLRLSTLDDMARAIKTMQVRGAPLIGAAAAYGLCLALRADTSDEGLDRAVVALAATRPTAINLKWALDEIVAAVRNRPREARVAAAYRRAAEIAVALAKHTAVESNGKVNNGSKDVPSVLLTPVTVDKSNIAQTVIKDGFVKMEDVYRNVPHDQWPKTESK
jgi:methylthioribose-1-phosphate isomerase